MKITACFSFIFLFVSAFCGLPLCAHAAAGDEHWDYQFGMPGADDGVLVIATNNGNMYVAGQFRSIAGVVASRVAMFDGLRWSPLGSGIGSATVYSLAFQGNNVYAGGYFTSAGGVAVNNIARWDGTNWNALGSGVNNYVYALATVGKYLYAAGMFTSAGGVAANNIARWDGTNWSALGSGITGSGNALVKTLATDGTNLYAGGGFTNAGGVVVNNLAVWDGTNWSAFHGGLGTNGAILSILVDGSDIYIGGSFSMAGGVPANNIVKWNGSGFEALGTGLSGTNFAIYAMTRMNGDLYVCGSFTNAGGVAVQNVACWNGSYWTNLTQGITATFMPLTLMGMGTGPDGRLYIGGLLDTAGTLGVYDFVAWDRTNWQVVRPETENGLYILSGGVSTLSVARAITISGNDLYVGGSFMAAGTIKANRVARWDGTNWWTLGSGMTGTNDTLTTTVAALAVSGGYVYAGGIFTNAGGVTASNIARWNGNTWSALGPGLNGPVSAIAANGGDVYAGGSFTNAGGSGANYIAKWNGSVAAISVGSDGIYVGGSFTTAGGATANGVARWDGATWYSLGSGTTNGVGGSVNAILPVSPTEVYVGGTFTTAGVVAANRIAVFDGSNWSALGSGMSGVTSPSVNALAYDGVYLHAAGWFTNAGGAMAFSIARWDGASWTAMGSGLARLAVGGTGPLAGMVSTLITNGSDLYAGGLFVATGDKVSSGVARWNGQITFAPPAVIRLDQPALAQGKQFQARVTASSGVTYAVETSTNLITWAPMVTNSASPFKFSDPSATNGAQGFYRARQIQ